MNWFNSDYYHILYKNRDKKEAEFFINNLIKKLKIKEKSKKDYLSLVNLEVMKKN